MLLHPDLKLHFWALTFWREEATLEKAWYGYMYVIDLHAYIPYKRCGWRVIGSSDLDDIVQPAWVVATLEMTHYVLRPL